MNKSIKEKFSFHFSLKKTLSVLLALFAITAGLYSTALLKSEVNVKVPYPNNMWISDYSPIWVVVSGERKSNVKRKEWVKKMSEKITNKYPDYEVRYLFKPTKSLEHVFLYPPLDQLQDSKEKITDSIKDTSNIRLTEVFDRYEMVDSFGNQKETLSPIQSDNSDIAISNNENEGNEYIYISSRYEDTFEKGSIESVKFEIKNISADVWKQDEIVLSSVDPELHNSVFWKEDEWINSFTPATISEEVVNPGEIATFRFDVNSDIALGKYNREFFAVYKVSENGTYTKLNGSSVYYESQIVPAEVDISQQIKEIVEAENIMGELIFGDKIQDLEGVDLSRLTQKEFFDLEDLDDEISSNLTNDKTGYLTNGSRELIIMQIKSKKDLKNLDNLKEFRNNIINEVDSLYIPKEYGIVDKIGKNEFPERSSLEVTIEVDPLELHKFNLTLEEIEGKIRQYLNKDIGDADISHLRNSIKFSREFVSIEDIENIMLMEFNQTGIKYYTSGTDKTVSKYGERGVYLKNIATLKEGVKESEIITRLLEEADNKIDIVGFPIHTINKVDEFVFNPKLLTVVLVVCSFIISLILSFYILPTILLYFSLFITSAISLYIYNQIFNSFLFQDYIIFAVVLVSLIFVMNVILNRLVNLRVHQKNRDVVSLLNIILKKDRKLILSIFGVVYLSVSVLAILNNVYYFRVVTLILLEFLIGIYGILYLFPTLVYIFSKIKYLRNFFNLQIYLDFTFVTELFHLSKFKNYLILFVCLLTIGIMSYRSFNFVHNFDLSLDKKVLETENKIRLDFGYDILYPFTISSMTEESISVIKKFVDDSSVFVNYDDLYSYIPKNQEEKIGLIRGVFSEIDINDVFPERKILVKNDADNLIFTIKSLITNLNELKEYKKDNDAYKSLKNNDIERAIVKLTDFINKSEENEVSLDRMEIIDNYIYQIRKKNFQSLSDGLQVRNPLTIQDFSAEDLRVYTKDGGFLTYIYPFSSIFNDVSRGKMADELTGIGYEIHEKKVLESVFGVDEFKLQFVLSFLFLFLFLGGCLILGNVRKIVVYFIVLMSFVLLHQSIFNYYKYYYSYLDFVTSVLIFVLFTVFVLITLKKVDRNVANIDYKVSYKSIISPLFSMSFICIGSTVLQRNGFNSFSYKSFLDFILIILLIFIFLPPMINIGLNFNLSLRSKLSRIRPKAFLDNFVDSLGKTFSSKGLRKRLINLNIKTLFKKFLNSIYEKRRKAQIQKYKKVQTPPKKNIKEKIKSVFKKMNVKGGIVQLNKIKNDKLEEYRDRKLKGKEARKKITEKLKKSDIAKDKTDKQKIEEKSEELNMPKRKIQDNRMVESSTDFFDEDKFDFGDSRYIPIHVFETDDELTIEAEVGDMNIYDIDVSIDNNILRLKNSDTYQKTPFERNIAIHVPIIENKISIHIQDNELRIIAPKDMDKIEEIEDEFEDENEDKNSVDKEKLEHDTIYRKENNEGEIYSDVDKKDIKGIDEKENLLKEIMQDDDETIKNNELKIKSDKDEKTINKITTENYRIEDIDGGVRVVCNMGDLKYEDIKIDLEHNVIHITNHDHYQGEPFKVDIQLDNALIHESIKTTINNNALVIEGQYRPSDVRVDKIIDETEEE